MHASSEKKMTDFVAGGPSNREFRVGDRVAEIYTSGEPAHRASWPKVPCNISKVARVLKNQLVLENGNRFRLDGYSLSKSYSVLAVRTRIDHLTQEHLDEMDRYAASERVRKIMLSLSLATLSREQLRQLEEFLKPFMLKESDK